MERHTGWRGAQGLVALLVLALVLGGGIALQQGLEPRQPAAAAPGSAPSGAWFCPHGGGPKQWRATLYLANPGSEPATARVSFLSSRAPKPARTITVPADDEVRVGVPARGREASTYVEYFGGWIAAGWVAQGGGGEIGVSAEPCSPAAARTWYLPDGTTGKGEDDYVVVMNPFATDAVLSIALFTKTRAPIRAAEWTDFVLKSGRSVDFHVNEHALGEQAVGAEIDVSVGRVAAASLGITHSGGIRSAIGAAATSTDVVLPAGSGAGQSTLVVMSPGDRGVRFGATLLSGTAAQPAGGLADAELNARSTVGYPVTTSGMTAVEVLARGGSGFVAAQRAVGVGHDSASTGGAASPSRQWVVLPSIAGEPAHPGLALVNPGDGTAAVTLHALVAAGRGRPQDVTVDVQPGSVVGAPRGFLSQLGEGAVLVRAAGGSIVAMGASTSLGVKGVSTYSMSMGIAVPDERA